MFSNTGEKKNGHFIFIFKIDIGQTLSFRSSTRRICILMSTKKCKGQKFEKKKLNSYAIKSTIR
eukprot:UN16960